MQREERTWRLEGLPMWVTIETATDSDSYAGQVPEGEGRARRIEPGG
jgi:hypothetical protein